MKMNVVMRVVVAVALLLAIVTPAQPALAQTSEVVLHVSGDASGTADGSLASPFGDPQSAVDEIIRRHNASPDLTTHYIIKVGGGTYTLARSIEIHADQFTNGVTPRLTIEPLNDEEVTFSGLAALDTSLFELPTDAETTARIRPEVRGSVYQADLAALNIPNLAEPRDNVRSLFDFDLFADAELQPIARFPNGDEDDHLQMGTVVHNGSTASGDGGIFEYKQSIDRHEIWADAMAAGRPVWLKGFWRVAWGLDTLRVETIDKDAGTVEFVEAPNLGIGSKYDRPGGSGVEPYWLENLLEEIDQPGEWSIDFSTQKLYYLPPGDIGSINLQLTGIDGAMLSARATTNFTIRGISFTGARDYAIEIDGGEDNLVHGCEIYKSVHGVALLDGARNSVVSCDIYDVGGHGIDIRTDIASRVASQHQVLNNHIYDVAKKFTIYHAGVHIAAVGVRVAHNVIHDTPHMGILMSGYDHTFEYNEIYNWATVSNDIGAIYSFLKEQSGGFIVRHNYAHDSPTGDGIYFDQYDIDTQVYSNLVINTYRAYLFKKPIDHNIRDNISINSGTGFYIPMSPGSVFERNVSIDDPRPTYLPGATDAQQDATLIRTIEDLAFANSANGDFRVGASASIYGDIPAFAPIDFAKVGFYADRYRDVSTPAGLLGDADCDGTVTIRDALLMTQHANVARSDSTCPLSNPAGQINLGASDANGDGTTSDLDAMLVIQCQALISNPVCPDN